MAFPYGAFKFMSRLRMLVDKYNGVLLKGELPFREQESLKITIKHLESIIQNDERAKKVNRRDNEIVN